MFVRIFLLVWGHWFTFPPALPPEMPVIPPGIFGIRQRSIFIVLDFFRMNFDGKLLKLERDPPLFLNVKPNIVLDSAQLISD